MDYQEGRYLPKNHCPVCGRELVGVFMPYGTAWTCSEHEKADILHAERGCKVCFVYPDNGDTLDMAYAAALLEIGVIYTVDTIEIGQSSSTIQLKEFPGKYFNTVQFERVG
jgi:hypothetical protein